MYQRGRSGQARDLLAAEEVVAALFSAIVEHGGFTMPQPAISIQRGSLPLTSSRMSISKLGSVKGKKCGRNRTFA